MARPDPVSATLCGLPGASLVKASDAVRGPVAEGVNVMSTVHDAPAASVVAHVPPERAKSAAWGPPIAAPNVSTELPVFVSVTV
jgi:hypothetical protein